MIKLKLSVVVLTKNEAKNIERCLLSVQFCNDVIVVDSQSTDDTVAIAKKFSANVFVQAWQGFVDQRNWAASKCSNDWVLFLDADEVVSSSLAEEIQKLLILGESGVAAYSVARKTFYSGKWIQHGGWYPSYVIRLVHRKLGKWQGGEVHEYWDCESRPVGYLSNPLHHFSFEGIEDQVTRNNFYSSLGAKQFFNKNVKFSYFKILTKPFVKFIETYLLKQGFRDGFLGFVISISASYSIFLKWAKLWELQRDSKKNNEV